MTNHPVYPSAWVGKSLRGVQEGVSGVQGEEWADGVRAWAGLVLRIRVE